MEQFRIKLAGIKTPDTILNSLVDLAKFGIDTKLELGHFLSQVNHESAGFTAIRENLNYSSAGLLKTFSKYFNSITAKSFARNPERIANRVYANRMGNGNEASGDG